MRKVIWVITILFITTITIFSFNYIKVVKPVNSVLKKDLRNDRINIDLHFKYYIVNNTLIFNLKSVSNQSASADVFRVLLQTASALKDENFKELILCYKGIPKFKLNGEYFNILGKEYDTQNAVYTMRTFPQNILDINGNMVYNKWTGGLLRVSSKQIEDFNDFNSKWYLDELILEFKNQKAIF